MLSSLMAGNKTHDHMRDTERKHIFLLSTIIAS